MGALMRSVPREMWGTLGAKKTVKEAWEMVQMMRVGVDRVKEISVQKLLKELENIEFKEGESVEDFGMRITNIIATLKSLNETIDDPCVVKNFLRVLSSRFNQVAVSIEMFYDMKTLLVEDLVGRLRATEDRFEDKDCKRPKKEKREEANLAKADVDQATLLLATVHDVGPKQPEMVDLQEKKVNPIECEAGVWHLGLDMSVHNTEHFGDGSSVNIEGLGSMIMAGHGGEHKVLTNVYYIPKLQSNIVSLGQLEEVGCKVVLENGLLQIFDRIDQGRRLIVSTPRTSNRLYKLQIKPATPVCLMLSITDTAWLWHARYGHLNFRALRELGRKGMVNGVPVVDHVEQSTVDQPTTDAEQGSPQSRGPEPASPSSTPMFPVFGSPQESATQTASSSHSRGGAGAQWVTPPGEQCSKSDELTPRFRSLSNLYDTTEEIQNLEYSGLCLLAADEPPSVEEALEEECWRKAMEAELHVRALAAVTALSRRRSTDVPGTGRHGWVPTYIYRRVLDEEV
ncbi:unnamed protein product [Miscanthus lutarioriparius]|uniref:GAG-pre-integrase domain-containing protein n=1 Tax=Miscanthus lutarioriparius TaxID=422564 RepID=A0A811NFF2_9POAL|nr:unnamed protein product [Miscanthus lutarioriparius]